MPLSETRPGPHVAFFLPHVGGGGTEKMVVRLANGLSAGAYTVDMVVVRAAGVYLGQLSRSIEVVDLHAANSYLGLPGLVAYLRRRRPLVLVSSLNLTNLIAIIAGRLSGSGARIVIRIENMISIQRRVPWKKAVEKRLLSMLYPRADRIIAVSGAVAADTAHYTGLAPSRIEVIYNPVIAAESSAGAPQASVHPWFAEGCPPVILAVGRLTLQKDFETLLRAFALLRQQRDSRLIILGEGEQRARLLALAHELHIENDLAMPGFVQNSFPFMQNCGVFALSSIYEGLPTVLIEALASGCPVLSTDCPGGSREILGEGAYGSLVPVRDPAAMAAVLHSILDGNRSQVQSAWLDKFRLEPVLDQTVSVLGLPVHPN